jgi:multiple sugar transport system permease protein
MWQMLSSKKVTPYLFLLPAALFGVIFFLLPILFSAYISLTNWDSLTPPRWVGLNNYIFLMTKDPFFWRSLLNTFYFAFGGILVGVPLALIVAYSFSNSKYQSVWRSLYWLPMITNVVAVAYIWQYVLHDTYGILNLMLAGLRLPGPGWLTDPRLAMISTILVFVWMRLGENMLLFSAGLADIDESYYEAARIDGANRWQLFTRITIPLLRPTILFVLITNFITGISYFTLMMVLTEGGPLRSTTVTGLYMYEMAFADLRMGRASAAAYILFVAIFVITLLQLRFFRRGGVEAH